MDAKALFAELQRFDTPTICNALEIARGAPSVTGFTSRKLIASAPKLPPAVGFARTATIRCSVAFDPAERRRRQLAYYEYLAQESWPTIAIIQDADSQPGLGAFWGEVNTHVHWGLGCVGAVTNGSMRDLDAMHPQFRCMAASLSPSHAWVQVVETGSPVDVLGMHVRHDDVVHADRHGAVVIPLELLEKLPAAIDLMARREKPLIDASKHPGCDIERLRQAFAEADRVK